MLPTLPKTSLRHDDLQRRRVERRHEQQHRQAMMIRRGVHSTVLSVAIVLDRSVRVSAGGNSNIFLRSLQQRVNRPGQVHPPLLVPCPPQGVQPSSLIYPLSLPSTPTRDGVDEHQSRLPVPIIPSSLLFLLIVHPFLPRFRPPNSIEQREGGETIISFDDNYTTVGIRSAATSSGPEKDGFTFDRIFPPGAKQQEVFDYGVKE